MSVHISEVSYSSGVSTDFVEIAADNGTDLSGYSIYVYTDGGLVLEGPYSLGNVQATIAGTDVYVLDDETPDFGGITKFYGVALVDGSGNVVQFISFDGNTITASEGPANGQSSTNIGAGVDYAFGFFLCELSIPPAQVADVIVSIHGAAIR